MSKIESASVEEKGDFFKAWCQIPMASTPSSYPFELMVPILSRLHSSIVGFTAISNLGLQAFNFGLDPLLLFLVAHLLLLVLLRLLLVLFL